MTTTQAIPGRLRLGPHLQQPPCLGYEPLHPPEVEEHGDEEGEEVDHTQDVEQENPVQGASGVDGRGDL